MPDELVERLRHVAIKAHVNADGDRWEAAIRAVLRELTERLLEESEAPVDFEETEAFVHWRNGIRHAAGILSRATITSPQPLEDDDEHDG
jgi:hypothetical protein